MKYRELYEFGCLTLKAAEISEYKLDARLLLEYVCSTTSTDMFLRPEWEVPDELTEKYRNAVFTRANRVPLQHITGYQGFMGLDFLVSPDVLIPRPDTETLVEDVLKELHDGMRILDMCTGSGCILLSLLHYSNNCIGVGADISDKALEIARKNAEKLGLEAEFVKSDLFSGISGKFDILVSNPPYIRTSEIEELMPEVRDHDPYIALDGHEDGTYFYEQIIKEAGAFLNRGALVAFEIGCDQGEAVSSLLTEAGYGEVEVKKDLCGNDRVVMGFFRG